MSMGNRLGGYVGAGRMAIASVHLSLAKLLWSNYLLASRNAASYRQVGVDC